MDDTSGPTPPQPGQPYAGSPQPGAYPQPGQPYPGHPQPGGYPQPIVPVQRTSHVWVIVGSIVGGLIILGFTFFSGAAVGWFVGSHHPGFSVSTHGYPGQLPPGWQNGGPGHHSGQDDQNDHNGS